MFGYALYLNWQLDQAAIASVSASVLKWSRTDQQYRACARSLCRAVRVSEKQI
jgi:hypothetical protein